MVGKPRELLVLTDAEQQTLQGWASRRTTAQGLALRSRIALACAQGNSDTAVAQQLGIDRKTVGRWRTRFLHRRLPGLGDEPRPGVPRTITDAQLEEVIVRTPEETPPGATHWSKRGLAQGVGLSPTTIHRIRQTFGLAPHQVEYFKISTDPLCVDKVGEVVGLCLDPPEKAPVLCGDEKPRIRALERTAPVLPMIPGVPERRSHGYHRHGTIDVFAALNTATGQVIRIGPAPCGGLSRLPGPPRCPDRSGAGCPSDL
jgi:transposase